MKRAGWGLALVAWGGFAGATQAATHTVTASSLNVRSGPGTGYAVIGTLSYGTAVTVTGTSGTWSSISSPRSGWVASQYLRPIAAAGTSCRYAGIRDAAFESWARARGFADGNSAIRSVYDQQIAWITQNTDADAVSLTTYTALWSSPAVSSSETALATVDSYNSFEETGRFYFKLAFSGRNYDHGGVASPTSLGRSDARCALMNVYDCGSLRWRSAMMHEASHLLRDDGYHHPYGSSTWCIMDDRDIWGVSSPAKTLCTSSCIPRINRVQ